MNASAEVPPDGLAYYQSELERPGESPIERVRGALQAAGLDPERLELDDLAALDEFHALGRAATLSLADLAQVSAEERVLDVGAGIGGPARVLAARCRARVTALDATEAFCEVNELLTRGTGLSDRVEIVRGNALAIPFPDASFDLVWTQAVSQNVSDKAGMIAEFTRVVRPGGRVAMFEIVAGPGGEVVFPVPWGDGPHQSHLVPAGELRELLAASGLTIRNWREGSDALAAIGKVAGTLTPSPASSTVALPVLMHNFEARMAGLGRNVAESRIALVQLVAERPM